jgi:hypothetical protein
MVRVKLWCRSRSRMAAARTSSPKTRRRGKRVGERLRDRKYKRMLGWEYPDRRFLASYDSFGRLIGLEQLGVVFQNSYAPQFP